MKEAVLKLGVGQIQISDETLEKLKAKADKGQLLSEFGAPRLPEGVGGAEKADRYRTILPSRVCAQITNLHRGDDGNVYGTVKPHGPMAKVLKQAMEGGNAEALQFGVRVVTRASVSEAITYDLVKF
ncbi:putative prohead core protein protease [Pseudomonas phage pPa_SNUABM_DT01]|nr:putative prohead core protein protease [Pseudomonas phage pPa_SNUABM_DT01]